MELSKEFGVSKSAVHRIVSDKEKYIEEEKQKRKEQKLKETKKIARKKERERQKELEESKIQRLLTGKDELSPDDDLLSLLDELLESEPPKEVSEEKIIDIKPIKRTVRSQEAHVFQAKKNGEEVKLPSYIQPIDPLDLDYAGGERYSICCKCGTKFEQDYVSTMNEYSSFNTCQKCRKLKSQQPLSKEVVVSVSKLEYEPYDWQIQAHKDATKVRKICIAAGARAGKDRWSNMQLLSDWKTILNENRHIDRPELVPSILGWLVAPTEALAMQNWRELKKFMPKEWVVGISESTKTMETIGGGIIEVRSAYDPESLVGVGLDICIITEGARVKDLKTTVGNIEDRVMSPHRGIGGKGGRLIINSSPRGKNFFYNVWCWGQKNHPLYDSKWKSYQIPSSANPEIAEKYAELVEDRDGSIITWGEVYKRRKGRQFLQDNEAKFLEDGGSVFSNVRENFVIDLFKEMKGEKPKDIKEEIKRRREPKGTFLYRIGYDPATGSSGDTPALMVREMNTNVIVRAIDLMGKQDDDQLDAVAYWARYYNNAEVSLLNLGNLLAEGQLLKRGVNVRATREQGQEKRKLVMSLQAAFTNGDVHLLDDNSPEMEKAIFQLDDYTEKNGKFSNESEDHDDYVSALYACYYDYAQIPEVKAPFMPRMKGFGYKRVGY